MLLDVHYNNKAEVMLKVYYLSFLTTGHLHFGVKLQGLNPRPEFRYDGAAQLGDQCQLLLLGIALHDGTSRPHLGHDAAGPPQIHWGPIVAIKIYPPLPLMHLLTHPSFYYCTQRNKLLPLEDQTSVNSLSLAQSGHSLKPIRPGILVLVNDSDWELLGQLTYECTPSGPEPFAGHGPKSMSAVPGTRAPEKSSTGPSMPACLGDRPITRKSGAQPQNSRLLKPSFCHRTFSSFPNLGCRPFSTILETDCLEFPSGNLVEVP
uniref:Ubiquitin-related modifier 1 n=1 Tax=Timema bartmani TaxID=61472 RepID=A0A7R9F6J3_9NEOP|nr:unnamed protein product [Timema bartmani]